MPVATIKVIEGVFSRDQKTQLIEKVTEAMIEVEGEDMRHLTWVLIEEVKQGDWMIGGVAPKPKVKE
ncbi:MAG: 4-oxalocrotonate tautomerase [Planctomycetes bacterium]|jgi:4-oxalocrotonate tautomerase|nr:4-oxalocrotonate tautomerase [Planctomycetota bacterium]